MPQFEGCKNGKPFEWSFGMHIIMCTRQFLQYKQTLTTDHSATTAGPQGSLFLKLTII